jgi:hypothetical protein
MAPRFLTILTGRNLPTIRQPRAPAPSTINEKTVADFTRLSLALQFLMPIVLWKPSSSIPSGLILFLQWPNSPRPLVRPEICR